MFYAKTQRKGTFKNKRIKIISLLLWLFRKNELPRTVSICVLLPEKIKKVKTDDKYIVMC